MATPLAVATTALLGDAGMTEPGQFCSTPAAADCAAFLRELRHGFDRKHVGGSTFHNLKTELSQLWAEAPVQAYIAVSMALRLLGDPACHAQGG